MANYTFDTTAEGWTTTDFAWNGANGNPNLGCLFADGSVTPFDYVLSDKTGVSISVGEGDNISFRVRLTGGLDFSMSVALVAFGGETQSAFMTIAPEDFIDGDTGWLFVSNTFSSADTITSLSIRVGNPDLADTLTGAYVDSFYIGEVEGVAELRLLGLTSDNSSLYVTAIEDDTLKCFTYSLSAFGLLSTDTFGTAAYTDPDTFTRGLFPVIKPATDGILYLYGRDGNDKQVWYKEFGGSIGWQDIGPGTATWGTAKYCVALMQFPLRWDVIAAFSDNDIYQTVTGTAAWVKLADAPTNLQAASRHPTSIQESLLAGTAAGTLHYTHNLAQSFDVAGGTIIAGTINHIEMSRY